MSEVVQGVIVGHADMAAALLRAVERIAGVTDAFVAVSNENVGPGEMNQAVEAAVGTGSTIVFTDLSSGSCALAGRLAASRGKPVAVVTGANLPMLLDFVFHRDMELAALVERVVLKGRTGISSSAPPCGTTEPEDRPC